MKEPGKEQIDKMIIFADNLLCVDSQRKKKKKQQKFLQWKVLNKTQFKKKYYSRQLLFVWGVV